MRKAGLALDIDETLSWTLGYWFEKMQELFGNPEGLSVKEQVKKYRYAENVPYWQAEEINAWKEKQRESSKLQEKLPLIKNADIYVAKINKIIPIIAYITNRPTAAIPGTKKWLKTHGFPDVPIYNRPEGIGYIDGNKWKVKLLIELYPKVVGIVDDNPGLLNFLPKSYKGKVFIYDFKGKLKPGKNIYNCKDWPETYEKILKSFPHSQV